MTTLNENVHIKLLVEEDKPIDGLYMPTNKKILKAEVLGVSKIAKNESLKVGDNVYILANYERIQIDTSNEYFINEKGILAII